MDEAEGGWDEWKWMNIECEWNDSELTFNMDKMNPADTIMVWLYLPGQE